MSIAAFESKTKAKDKKLHDRRHGMRGSRGSRTKLVLELIAERAVDPSKINHPKGGYTGKGKRQKRRRTLP